MNRTLPRLFRLPKFLQMSKTPDILTLFHHPTHPASTAVLAYLRSASAPPASSPPNTPPRFELDVISYPTLPTPSQYQSILEFLGAEGRGDLGRVLKGVRDAEEGARRLEEGGGEEVGEAEGEGLGKVRLERPIVVDWNNGRVVVGGDINAVKTLVETLPK